MKRLILDVFRPLRDIFLRKEIRALYFKASHLLTLNRYKPIHKFKLLNFVFDIPDGPSAYHSFKEIFCDQIYRFPTSINKPFIIDCGANLGMSIAFFKKMYPSSIIMAIEADKFIYNFLQSNVSINKFRDVEMINAAVWTHSNGVKFNSEGADGGSVCHGVGNFVSSLRLRDILSSYKEIDLLKIDIEGAELDVLRDCDDNLGMVKNLFVEYHSLRTEEQRLDEILYLLKKNGFRYEIQDLFKRKLPFFEDVGSNHFDLQLNIFCTRI
jgi:FkbM family methyltransferase